MGMSPRPLAITWFLQVPAWMQYHLKCICGAWDAHLALGTTTAFQHTLETFTDYSQLPVENWWGHRTDRCLPQQLATRAKTPLGKFSEQLLPHLVVSGSKHHFPASGEQTQLPKAYRPSSP